MRFATAMISASSFWNRMFWPSVDAPRSNASVPFATRQPSPGSPTMFAASVRAPSKNVSENSAVPVICGIGRISTPFCFIGTSR